VEDAAATILKNDKLFPGIGSKNRETAEKYVKFERPRRKSRGLDFVRLWAVSWSAGMNSGTLKWGF
jgi:hypothetical protein